MHLFFADMRAHTLHLARIAACQGTSCQVAAPVVLPLGDGLALGTMTASNHIERGGDASPPVLSIVLDEELPDERATWPSFEDEGPVEVRLATRVPSEMLQGWQPELLEGLRAIAPRGCPNALVERNALVAVLGAMLASARLDVHQDRVKMAEQRAR
jgi:hypothetical protein